MKYLTSTLVAAAILAGCTPTPMVERTDSAPGPTVTITEAAPAPVPSRSPRALKTLPPAPPASEAVEDEAVSFFLAFHSLTRSEQRELCGLFYGLPLADSFGAYEDAYGTSALAPWEFELMLEVACEDY